MATHDHEQPVGVLVLQEVDGARKRDREERRGRRPRSRRGARAAAPSIELVRCWVTPRSPGRGEGAAGGPAAPVTSRASSGYAQGQLASMSSRTPSRESGPLRMYSSIPVQKLPLPDLGRHEVGGVEAAGALLERRRSGSPRRRRGCRWRSSPARRSTFGEMRDDATHAAHLALHVLGDEPVEEVDDLGPVAVRADDGELTGVEDALLVDGRAAGTSRSPRRPPCPPGRTS